VVLSAYRPWNADPNADPQDAADSERLAAGMTIGCPTLNLQGADDGVDLFEDTQLGQEAFYRGGFERAVLEGCGHFLHRERPEAVAQRIIEFIGQPPR
jgi:pimeloyl-ACP methyl ester carboxylesterase